MTVKKKRIIGTSNAPVNSLKKPSTAVRAAITAGIRPSRGKQLVEHDPFLLIPDPQNPRPGEVIDDIWLKTYLKIGSSESLCRFMTEGEGDYYIPCFNDLPGDHSTKARDSYEFLRNLAYSIRVEGLIEPIEIYLADKKNEPEYFYGLEQSYGYVVLEGHQRRLAAMMSGVPTVTCVEITDETILAKLKIKHRKLRRQLSENNLRKGLSVSQNFVILKELLIDDECKKMSAREISSIIGLNEDIASSLKKLILNIDNYPEEMIELIHNDKVTYSWIRKWSSKSREDILRGLTHGDNTLAQDAGISTDKLSPKVKARGRSGGAIKKSATFKVKSLDESERLQKLLLLRFPEINFASKGELTFKSLEELLIKIKDVALEQD